MYHVYTLERGRALPHSVHLDRRKAEQNYWLVSRSLDAALVREDGGRLSVLSASVPFLQAEPAFRRAVERAVGGNARFA